MTLEAVFNTLTARWRRLLEVVEHDLLWCVTKHQPQVPDEHHLGSEYTDAATDLVSAVRDGLAACAAVPRPPDLAGAVQALVRCQGKYNAAAELFETRLASYGRLRRLAKFGREKGGASRDWAAAVRTALGVCRGPLGELSQALFGGWQEVAERVGGAGVSVRTTNIGQQVTVPAEPGAAVT
jgi:hypothetical protein